MRGCLFGGGVSVKDDAQAFREHIARLQWEVQYERGQRCHFQQAYQKELVRNGVLEHELATSAEAARELKRSLLTFLGDDAYLEDDLQGDSSSMDEDTRRPSKMLRLRSGASTGTAADSETACSDGSGDLAGGSHRGAAKDKLTIDRLAERLLTKANNLQHRLLTTSSSFSALAAMPDLRASHASEATNTTFTSSEDTQDCMEAVHSRNRNSASFTNAPPARDYPSWRN